MAAVRKSRGSISIKPVIAEAGDTTGSPKNRCHRSQKAHRHITCLVQEKECRNAVHEPPVASTGTASPERNSFQAHSLKGKPLSEQTISTMPSPFREHARATSTVCHLRSQPHPSKCSAEQKLAESLTWLSRSGTYFHPRTKPESNTTAWQASRPTLPSTGRVAERSVPS